MSDLAHNLQLQQGKVEEMDDKAWWLSSIEEILSGQIQIPWAMTEILSVQYQLQQEKVEEVDDKAWWLGGIEGGFGLLCNRQG